MRRVGDLSEPMHQEAHIHHAHWFALDPGNEEDNYTGGNTEWIFGNGDEETRADYQERSAAEPGGPVYGQYIGLAGPQLMIYMLHNKTSQPLNVYIVLDVTFRHGTAEQLAHVRRAAVLRREAAELAAGRVEADDGVGREVGEPDRVQLVDVHRVRLGRPRQVPLAPWRDDFDVRLKRVIGQLEAHLVVALAGRAVRDSVGAFFSRDLDLVLCDHRAGEGSAHQVHAFVNRIRLDRGPDVVAHKLFAQIFDVELRSASRERLLFEARQLSALAHVSAVTNNFAVVLFLQPAKHD